jgi:hypothetical protein
VLRPKASFAAVAKRASDAGAEERKSGGLLGELTFAELSAREPHLVKPVLGLPAAGGVTPLVHSATGYHIVTLEAKVAPRPMTLDEARTRIAKELRQERGDPLMKSLLVDLGRKAGVRYFVTEMPARRPPAPGSPAASAPAPAAAPAPAPAAPGGR